MGCCLSTPVDFEGEVNLYHFDLHRVVGKGAFGKVSLYPNPFVSLALASSPLSGFVRSREAALSSAAAACRVRLPLFLPSVGHFFASGGPSLAFDSIGPNSSGVQCSVFWTG